MLTTPFVIVWQHPLPLVASHHLVLSTFAESGNAFMKPVFEFWSCCVFGMTLEALLERHHPSPSHKSVLTYQVMSCTRTVHFSPHLITLIFPCHPQLLNSSSQLMLFHHRVALRHESEQTRTISQPYSYEGILPSTGFIVWYTANL